MNFYGIAKAVNSYELKQLKKIWKLLMLCSIFYIYLIKDIPQNNTYKRTNCNSDINRSFHMYPFKKSEIIVTDFLKKYNLLKGV
jgi:hypothetical protein